MIFGRCLLNMRVLHLRWICIFIILLSDAFLALLNNLGLGSVLLGIILRSSLCFVLSQFESCQRRGEITKFMTWILFELVVSSSSRRLVHSNRNKIKSLENLYFNQLFKMNFWSPQESQNIKDFTWYNSHHDNRLFFNQLFKINFWLPRLGSKITKYKRFHVVQLTSW